MRLVGEGAVNDPIAVCRELLNDPTRPLPVPPTCIPRPMPEDGEDEAYAWSEFDGISMLLRPRPFSTGCRLSGRGVVIDLGAFYFGHLQVEFFLNDTEPATVEIGYGHETDDAGAPLAFTWDRARVAARHGIFQCRFSPRGARYLFFSSRGKVNVTGLAMTESLAPPPGPAQSGRFACDDKAWERVWRSGLETLRYSRTDIVSSDNFREFCAWLGDTHWICLNYYYTFFDPAFIRRTWSLYAKSVDAEGRMPSVVPAYAFFNLPAWTWQFWMGVWEYHLYTGDISLLREAWPACRATHRYYQRFKTDAGLLHEPEGWRIVDWARIDLSGDSFVLNALYHRALGSLMEIARALDLPDAVIIATERELLRSALAAPRFLDNRSGLIRDRAQDETNNGGTFSQHAQILAYGLGLWNDETQGDLMGAILDARAPMCTLGESSYHWACDILKNHSGFPRFIALVRRAYLQKVREGATCLGHRHPGTDVANPTERNNSPAHGWAAAPVYISGSCVLGVSPLEPGYTKVQIRPMRIFSRMTTAHGAVPTPKGLIQVDWRLSPQLDGHIEISLPEGMPGILDLHGWPHPSTTSGLSPLGEQRHAIIASSVCVHFNPTPSCTPAKCQELTPP